MRDLTELTDQTTSYEIFTHVYWRIVTREITDFSSLVKYLKPVEEGSRKDYVLKMSFPLIREIHWGFFRELNARTWPKLWGELTRPHHRYDFAGELKRSMTITEIYCAFIDIHGYTALTRSSKDAPLLELLDICIETDVKEICRDNHVIGNRARGDEIILIGTTSYDVVNTVLSIADYFGEKSLPGNLTFVRRRRADRLKLPPLSISAGIAGGKKYDSLLITAGGDLSGPVVNLAARLQSQANNMTSDFCQILVTQTVRMKYETEAGKQFAPMFSASQLAFLDVGTFAFKGVEVSITEVLFNREEMHRLAYEPALEGFLATLGKEAWQDAVFLALCSLIVAVCDAMPSFTIDGATNAGVKSLARQSADIFEAGDFTRALNSVSRAVGYLVKVPEIDYFLRLYIEAAVEEYRRIFDSYNSMITRFVEDNRTTLISSLDYVEYEKARSNSTRLEQFRSLLISKVPADKRQKLWVRLTKDLAPSLKEALYLGK